MIVENDTFGYSYVIEPHGIEVQVDYDGDVRDEDGDWRQAYTLHIRTERHHYIDNTLRSGTRDVPDARKAWATAVTFLSACDEAWRYGTEGSENRGLFPEWVIDIVSPHIDELDLHAYDIENPDAA